MDVTIQGQVIGVVTNHGGHVLITGDVGAIDDHAPRVGMTALTDTAVVRQRVTGKP